MGTSNIRDQASRAHPGQPCGAGEGSLLTNPDPPLTGIPVSWVMNKIKEALTSIRRSLTSTTTLAPLCAICASIALIQSVRVESLHRTATAASASLDESLEQMHAMGYESGYQSAIVDAYTETARYLIEEETSGAPTMWKKVEIEEPNLSALSSRLAARNQEPLSASAE